MPPTNSLARTTQSRTRTSPTHPPPRRTRSGAQQLLQSPHSLTAIAIVWLFRSFVALFTRSFVCLFVYLFVCCFCSFRWAADSDDAADAPLWRRYVLTPPALAVAHSPSLRAVFVFPLSRLFCFCCDFVCARARAGWDARAARAACPPPELFRGYALVPRFERNSRVCTRTSADHCYGDWCAASARWRHIRGGR